MNTLTIDNGKMFSAFKKIEASLGIDVNSADPYCSWQRGTNENSNGLLRRLLPKGTNFTNLSDRQLQQIIDTITLHASKINMVVLSRSLKRHCVTTMPFIL